MRRSLPVRGDPSTWFLMVKVGKILMRIGLLFRVIRNVSPLALGYCWYLLFRVKKLRFGLSRTHKKPNFL